MKLTPRTLAVAAAFVGLWALWTAPALRAQSYSPSDEARSHSLIDSARTGQGLGALADNGGLDSMARAQAARMASRGAIYHNPNLGPDADAAGVNWTSIGENVGVGHDIGHLHDGFMSSSGHRANILHPGYNSVGLGVVVGDDGRTYVAQVFAAVEGSAPPAPEPEPAPAVEAPQPPPPTQAPTVNTSAPAPPRVAEPEVRVESSSQAAPQRPNVLVGGVVNLDVVF